MSFKYLMLIAFIFVYILMLVFVVPDFVLPKEYVDSGEYSLRIDIDKDSSKAELLAKNIVSRFRYNDSKDTASFTIEGDSIIWIDIEDTDEYKMNIYQIIENSSMQFIVDKEKTFEIADSVERICLTKLKYNDSRTISEIKSMFRSFYSVRCNEENLSNKKIYDYRVSDSKDQILEYLGDSLEYRLENLLIHNPFEYSEYNTIALLYCTPVLSQGSFSDVSFNSTPKYENTYTDLTISFKTELPESVIADIPFDENGKTIFGIIVNEEVRINGTLSYDGEKFNISDEFSVDEAYFLKNFFLCDSIPQKFEYCYQEKEELFSSIKNSKAYKKYKYLKKSKK